MSASFREDAQVCCSGCGAPLSIVLPGPSVGLACASCEAELEVEVFPALFKVRGSTEAARSLNDDTEASCYYHPGKRAVVACSMCGRFLCALCDISLAGQRLCPSCVERSRSREQLTELVTSRTLYDQIALALAVIPIITIWFTIFTAPMALYMAVRHWRSPTSVLPRTKIRFVMAILISGMTILGWVATLIYSMS